MSSATAVATTLPKFVVFYSTAGRGKYWTYLTNDARDYIVLEGTKASDPGSRFEIEQSKVHPSMVHIRCSFNNKYLRQQSNSSNSIVAEADKPEDDQTMWSSTLFLPEFISSSLEAPNNVSFLHVNLGLYLFDTNYNIIASSSTSTNPRCQFQFVDWESLVTLPKHLTFHGDNGKYLGLLLEETGAGLRFEVGDLTDKTIVHEVVSLPDGTVRVKNVSQGSYWKLELVESRRIEDIKFNLSNGNDWVYDITNNVILNPGQDVSNDSNTTRTFDVKISYKDTKTSSTWTSINSSLKTGPIVTIKPDQIPHITDSSKIELTTPFQESYVWGETTTKNSHEFKVKQVKLEPMTMVTIKLLATVGTCHVPLTYTRYDVLDETTGQEETHMMDDGVYTGTNYFNFTFEQSDPKPITKKN
ncbi:hypothetical protein LINPERPRIM_LOCUS8286 [Linum perenne]